jgi:ribosomal-protein-alanine N-acetyltransferase
MIRKMTLEDLPKVLVLEKALFSAPWSEENYRFELLENPYAHYVVKEEQGLLGYLGLWLNEDALQITTLGVDTSFQNRGIGQSLVAYALEYARMNEVSVMTLEVRVSNEKAIHLYEKNGFKKAALRKQYYSHPDEDAILMMKTFEQM